jgi:uncharacterized protein DUF5694
MKKLLGALALACALAQTVIAAPLVAPEGAPIDVVVLGTFHFDNPGRDIANVQVDDVLAKKRQAEIGAILDGLARFNPTKVAVESQRRQAGTNFSEKYPIYRTGKMEPSRNEVVQLGFGLAARLGHANVYAVDVDGDFPFDAVMAFAKKTGHDAKLGAAIAAIQAWTTDLSAQLKTKTLGQTLRFINEPASVVEGNAFYLDTLRYGALDEQPGANLVSSWYARNFNICARIVQIAEPGDRILIVYGSGHAFLLRHCLGGVPGWHVKEANDYLPN